MEGGEEAEVRAPRATGDEGEEEDSLIAREEGGG